jgi:hypothetical protein
MALLEGQFMRGLRDGQIVQACILILSLGMAVAHAGSGPTITLQPVQPTTSPPSTYPPGTTIIGQEIVVGSVPARVWLEIHITGWAPEILMEAQATVYLVGQGGGGFSGANALCDDHPARDAGHLGFGSVSCPSADLAGHNVCTAALSGACSPRPVLCTSWDGVNPPYFPAGLFCSPGFQNVCHPRWPGAGDLAIWQVHIGSTNYRYTFAAYPQGVPPDLRPTYMGTLVLDIPATAKGTYTIGFDDTQTLMLNHNPPGSNDIPISALIPAKITVPCGRCCHGVGGEDVQCEEALSANECAALADSVFTADVACPENGGPACAECVSNGHCDDGVFCNGEEICGAHGACEPGTPPCGEWEFCEEQPRYCAPRIPTVSNWGMVVMALALAVAAKLRYGSSRHVQS